MGRPQPVEATYPDEQTLQAWKDMRLEILHELQEGASTDIPDALIDQIAELAVVLNSLRAETESLTRLPLTA
jgi:hypothetical protein